MRNNEDAGSMGLSLRAWKSHGHDICRNRALGEVRRWLDMQMRKDRAGGRCSAQHKADAPLALPLGPPLPPAPPAPPLGALPDPAHLPLYARLGAVKLTFTAAVLMPGHSPTCEALLLMGQAPR